MRAKNGFQWLHFERVHCSAYIMSNICHQKRSTIHREHKSLRIYNNVIFNIFHRKYQFHYISLAISVYVIEINTAKMQQNELLKANSYNHRRN